MTNASTYLRRELPNFSTRNKDRNVAVCHSERRTMRAIESELDGGKQSIKIRNKISDRIRTWYRSRRTDKRVFTEKKS